MYRMHWGKVEGARAEVDFRLGPDPGEAQTRVDAHTQGWARTLFQMDAVHLSVVHLDGLRPVRAEQTESRTKRREVYRLDFPDGPGTAVRHHRKAEPPGAPEVPDPEDKRFAYPTLRDMTTAFLYLRSQPLEKDEPHVFVIMSAKTPYLARVRVVGREPIAVNAAVGHPQPAIELDVGLQKIDREGRLKPHKFFKSARVWLSDDADRVILRAESQIFIGRVSMELEKFGH